jgi:16S rRNA (cytidine1402-2'-O)-methyltransferase
MDAGVLYVVATPIGNLEDMTHRAVRVLGQVDVIAAEDTRAAARLLGHFQIRGPRVVSMFEGNEAGRAHALLAELAAGRRVAIISEAGTPGISDPGERLIAAAVAAGVRVEVVPGPVAAVAALVASGLPTGRFLFLGFPPREAGARQQLFGTLRREVATMIFYEAPDRLAATCADLAAALGPDRPAALARELTKRHEEHVRAPLAALAERYAAEPPRGECTLVVQGAAPGADEAGEADLDDITAQMRALLAQGLGPRDAAARLVVVTGKPRRQLYQLALSLAREP